MLLRGVRVTADEECAGYVRRYIQVEGELRAARTFGELGARWLDVAYDGWTVEQQRGLELVVSLRLLQLAREDRPSCFDRR